MARRFDEFETIIATVEAELADDHFSAGFGNFREALNLSRGFPALEERVGLFAVEQSRRLLPQNWHIARSLLLEATEAGSRQALPEDLLKSIEEQEREASIRNSLNAADLASSIGMASLARQRLEILRVEYPGDPRIEARLNTLEALSVVKPQSETLWQNQTEAISADTPGTLARATLARAREFERAGFYADALDHWKELQKIDPQHPGLDHELARLASLCNSCVEHQPVARANHFVDASPPTQPSQPVVGLGNSLPQPSQAPPDRPRTSVMLICSAGMLATSGLLVWMHFSVPVATPAEKAPATPDQAKVGVKSRPRSAPRHATARVAAPSIEVPPSEGALSQTPAVPAVDPNGAVSGAAPQESPNPEVLQASQAKTDPEPQPPPAIDQTTGIPPPSELPAPEASTSVTAAPPVADLENKTQAEYKAWSAVDPADLHSVESYLSRFPDGANHALAEQTLINIRRIEADKLQSNQVLEVVQQYADAWTRRDVDSILSLQRNLDRKRVKAQLSPVRSLVMNIAPAAEPSIVGEQATLLCRRQVLQIFKDGVPKQTPEETVTFVLSRRNGSWTIDGTRQ